MDFVLPLIIVCITFILARWIVAQSKPPQKHLIRVVGLGSGKYGIDVRSVWFNRWGGGFYWKPVTNVFGFSRKTFTEVDEMAKFIKKKFGAIHLEPEAHFN